MLNLAVSLYQLIIIGVIIFQCCLIAGAPWGHLTQGGQHPGALPTKNRIGAGVSIPLLLLMAAAVGSAAGHPPAWPGWTGWLALGIQSLSTGMNWLTPSPTERRLWGPITSIMWVLAVYVVL